MLWVAASRDKPTTPTSAVVEKDDFRKGLTGKAYSDTKGEKDLFWVIQEIKPRR